MMTFNEWYGELPTFEAVERIVAARVAEVEQERNDALRDLAAAQADAPTRLLARAERAEAKVRAVEALDLVEELDELRSFVWAETRHEPTRAHVAELRERLAAVLGEGADDA